MSELNTKTLSELTTVDSLLNTDTVLIESGGRMKKANPSVIGGGGGGGSVLTVNCSVEHGTHGETTYTLDKTWKEINDAFMAGTNVVVLQNDGANRIKDIVTFVGEYADEEGASYQIGFGIGYDALTLFADSINGYPEYVST